MATVENAATVAGTVRAANEVIASTAAIGARRQGHELALKTLVQLESSDDEPREVMRYHAAEDGAAPAASEFAEQLVRGVLKNRERIDQVIAETSEHWRLDQMAKVERVILR